MKPLSPEQWRVLDHLYQYKLHALRIKVSHVREAQKVTDADLFDLDARGLISARLADDEYPLNLIPVPLLKSVRLRLTSAGLKTVYDDPGNQIRYTLGQHDGPMTLAKLFVHNTIVFDDVRGLERSGLITVSIDGIGAIEVSDQIRLYNRDLLAVALTAKGREYLPF